MSQNKLALASAETASDRYTLRRVSAALARRVPVLGRSNFAFLSKKGFSVSFQEEDVPGLKLPRLSDYARSVNLFDQREVLFRAIVAAAIKGGIIDSTRNFIDAGAQNGDTALSWARLVRGVVYAIDPSAGNIAFLKSVAKTNRLDNIDAFVTAVGEKDGILYPASDVNHTYFTETPITRYGARNPVAATSFDALHSRGRIENVGFLHLDVEGMELQTLRGAVGMLASDRPVVVFECHVTIDDTDALLGLMKSLGYVVFMLNEATPGGRPDCVNFIAFPSQEQAHKAMNILNFVKPKQEHFKATLGDNLIPTD